jgi:hypothetical protein
MALAARCLADRPAEVARFLATGAGRSFATGAAFERALDSHDPLVTDAASWSRTATAWSPRCRAASSAAWARRFRAQPHGTPAGPVFDPELDAPARAAAARALWAELARVVRAEGWLGGDVTLTLGGPATRCPELAPPSALGALRRSTPR